MGVATGGWGEGWEREELSQGSGRARCERGLVLLYTSGLAVVRGAGA